MVVRRQRLASITGLGALVVLGLLCAALPFGGDQALFAAGGRQLARGQVYWRDVWDLKPPGVFVAYAVAGLVGRGEVAAHLVELAVLVAVAGATVAVLRQMGLHPAALVLAPALVFGPLYLAADPYLLGQLEVVTSGALLLVALGLVHLVEEATPSRWAPAATGLAAGLAVVGKGILVLPLVAIAAGVLLPGRRWRRLDRRAVITLFVVAAVPVLAVITTAAATATLGIAWRTTVAYPPRISRLPGLHGGDLARALLRTGLRLAAPTVALAAVGAVSLRRRVRPALGWGCVAWLVAIPVTVAGQRWSAYQAVPIIAPLGVLAAYGIDSLAGAGRWRSWRPAIVALAVVGLLVAAVPAARNAVRLARHDLALTASGRVGYRAAVDPVYGSIAEHAGEGPRGPAWVLGDPRWLWLGGHDSAISLNGWSPEQWLSDQEAWARTQLDGHPGAPVLVDDQSKEVVEDRRPAFWTWFTDRYTPILRIDLQEPGSDATWWRRR